MTFDQWIIIAILLVMLIAYATERFRIEFVAMTGLGVAYLSGIVPVQNVFAGFSSPAVITVAEVLLIVSALSATRVVDDFSRRIIAHANNERAVLAILCATGAFISIFMNNIGALALMFPVALSVSSRLNIAPGRILMALSFATLLGGMCSLTGTPANLVVNQWKISETGAGFGYFELALIGGPVTLAGLAWVVLAAPRVFRHMEPPQASPFDGGPSDFLTEMSVPALSVLAGLHLPEAEERHGISIHGVVRHGNHVFARRGDIVIAPHDTLLIEGPLNRLDELEGNGSLQPATAHADQPAMLERMEVVVMPESLLLGSRISDIQAFAEGQVSVACLASRRRRIEGRFEDLQIGMGDVLVLSGERHALREAVADCGVLPLSRRRPRMISKMAKPSVAIFTIGILLTAFDILPTEIAFGAVVIAMAMLGSLNLRGALQEMNWSIIILLACMIPLGIAVEQTGAARVIANTIAEYLPVTSPLAVATTVLLMAVIITPFIDNVSTAVVLSPIAASMASRTGVAVEPLLMAVAVGASLDFLTPFGHHNNAVVMGAAGYRFRDFPRLGAPLLIICILAAILALASLQSGPALAIFY
jgi:di/tricarboxylate transporter